MEIKPAYVTFEQAKLLKELGFDEPCFAYWQSESSPEPTVLSFSGTKYVSQIPKHRNTFLTIKGESRLVIPNELDYQEDMAIHPENYERLPWGLKVIAPEQWQVIEWLRLNRGVWIYPQIKGNSFQQCYIAMIVSNLNPNNTNQLGEYTTPQAAYLAAFDYILPKLLKP